MQEFTPQFSQEKYSSLTPIILGIAHEIRNPLQGILAAVAVLREHPSNDPLITRFASILQDESSRIDQIIHELLELTQGIQFDSQQHSVPHLLSIAVRSIQDQAQSSGAVICINAPDDLPNIKGDGKRLSHAFASIIRNAVESKRSDARVTVAAKTGNKQLLISISDDGSGIPEEDLPNVFQPFFSTKPKRPGLGLSIAEQIILAHAGRVTIRSEVSRGTEVQICLPV